MAFAGVADAGRALLSALLVTACPSASWDQKSLAMASGRAEALERWDLLSAEEEKALLRKSAEELTPDEKQMLVALQGRLDRLAPAGEGVARDLIKRRRPPLD